MNLSKTILWIFAAVCVASLWSVQAQAQPVVLKLATLAPEGTTWMKTFHRINQELETETGGALTMRAYPGGVMGDDQAVLRKMRIGQIHIAGLTGLGLGLIFQDTHVLGTPFLFSNYLEVDHVMKNITKLMEQGFLTRGFTLIGWSEIGFVYMMSNKPVTRLEDLQEAKVWLPEGDLMSQAVFRKAGCLRSRCLSLTYYSPSTTVLLTWFTTRLLLPLRSSGLPKSNTSLESL